MSLLDQAKAIKVRNNTTSQATDDELEISVALFNGEITDTQFNRAIGVNNGVGKAGVFLRSGVRQGKVEIKIKGTMV